MPEWRPTLLFLFAAQIAIWDAQWGIGLLGRLIKGQDRTSVKANPAPAIFIADALELCLAKKYSVPEELKEDFRGVSLEGSRTRSACRRAKRWDCASAEWEIPRIFGLRDPRAYVDVPAGTYSCTDAGKTVTIVAPFRVGRYPVTNGQYRAFLNNGGYRQQRWWSKAGWQWLQDKKVTEPRLWHDRRWNAPNQPVVDISFWEAEACCAWASGRLPTEEEWEVVACGRQDYTYPWGNDWQDGICNSAETALGVTSPIGLFPHARQAELGIEDLAGNVWEWCGSLYPRPVFTWLPVGRRIVSFLAGPGFMLMSTLARASADTKTRSSRART